jgi:SAM-dependent methyltransferase
LLGLAAFLFGSFRATAWIWKRLPGLPAGWPTAAAWAMAAGCAGFAAANLTEHGLIHDRGAHAGLALAALLVLVKRPPRSWPPERKQLFNAAWDESPISLMPALAERLEHRAPLYALLEQALARGGSKILEMGCGPALDSLALAARPGWEVHAVDGSQRALALAESSARVLNRPLHLHHADVRRTGLAAASFDVIFSQGLWEHFPDPAPLWQEAVRLLKPGGMMVIDVPQGWNPYTLIKWGHQWLGDWPWGWETQYSLPGLKAWGRKYGLRTKAAAGYGYRGGTWDGTAALKNSMLRFAPKAWKQFEQRTGAWWMMNVVVLMEKTADDGKLKGVGARCAASLP